MARPDDAEAKERTVLARDIKDAEGEHRLNSVRAQNSEEVAETEELPRTAGPGDAETMRPHRYSWS
jgi:hypothetical protein